MHGIWEKMVKENIIEPSCVNDEYQIGYQVVGSLFVMLMVSYCVTFFILIFEFTKNVFKKV